MIIKAKTPSLNWLNSLISLYSSQTITVPTQYRDKVLETKKLLISDISGLVNSLLDFAIECALIDYRVESPNSNLSEMLNNWLGDINSPLIGKIPRGIQALAKEYFRERWKGSSCLLLRTFWETVDGIELPTTMCFVDGEDIVTKGSKKPFVDVGEWKYSIRLSETENIKLPSGKNEEIFIQKPYDSWSAKETTPFIIRRGIYKNAKLLELVSNKGETIVNRAIEYLFSLKKGDKDLMLKDKVNYDADDLKKIKENLDKLLEDRKINPGTSSYITNFDTEMEHIIPDYSKAINSALYTPIEKRILAALGLIEIVESVASTRRESILNPKPFISEVKSGIEDFCTLINDIIYLIKKKNISKHNKFFSQNIIVRPNAIKQFLTKDDKILFRSLYDRGSLSKQTFVEVTGEFSFAEEVERRKLETKQGLDKTLYPPVVQNIEKDIEPTKNEPVKKDDEIPDDKKGVEKKNFTQSKEETTCECGEVFDFESQQELSVGSVECPECGKAVSQKDYEEAPYTKKNFPTQIKNLPAGAKSIWISTFNRVLKETNDEDDARKAAWRNVKLKYKKSGEKWIKKTKAEISKESTTANLEDLIQLKKLEVLEKQSKVLSKVNKKDN